MAVDERVKHIIAEYLECPESSVELEARFADLCGSLEKIELLLKFEDEFDVEISDGEAKKIVTVNDAVRRVQQVLDERTAKSKGAN